MLDWLFYIILLIVFIALLIELQTQRAFRQFIDIRTGKPIPVGSGFIMFIYYIVRSRIDLSPIDGLKKFGLKYPAYASRGIGPSLILCDPEDIKYVLKKIDDFPKVPTRTGVDFLLKYLSGPKNIVSVNNPEWHDQRVLLNKTFSANALFFEPICKKVELCISKWEKQSEVYVGLDLQKMTLDALATSVFGLDFDTLNGKFSEPLHAYNECMDRMFNPFRFVFPWINKLPISWNTKLIHNLKLFDQYCWQIMDDTKKKIEDRKKNQSEDHSEERKNLSLIEDMYENQLPEEVIRDNVSIFFLAGHETTASALSWALSLLVQNPSVQDRARKEAFEKVPDELNYEALKDLPYIEGLMKEGLRIHPPAPSISGRYAAKDSVIGNVRIPAGTFIDLNIAAMSNDPKTWGDPELVRPERWFPENLTKAQRAAWMPFSVGPRVCIGMNFSLLEQKIFLVKLLKRFSQIKLSSKGRIQPKIPGFIYTPDYDTLILEFVK